MSGPCLCGDPFCPRCFPQDVVTRSHASTDRQLPKVFLYANRAVDGLEIYGYALAEDGSSLYVDVFRNHIYVRQGLTSRLAKQEYDEYYAEGYQLVDYIDSPDEELDQRDDFLAALQANVNASVAAAEQRAAAAGSPAVENSQQDR